MQQYEGLSDRDRQYILKTNQIRSTLAHGGEYKGDRAYVKQYALYVGQSIQRNVQQNVGQSARQAPAPSTAQSTAQSTGSFNQQTYTSQGAASQRSTAASQRSTAHTAQARTTDLRAAIGNNASKQLNRLYQGSVWRQWVIAHFIGLALNIVFLIVGSIVAAICFGSAIKPPIAFITILLYTVSAFGFGIPQQRVVGSRLVNGNQWALFTAIGGASLGSAFGSLATFAEASSALFKGMGQPLQNPILGGICWIGIGAATGLAIGFMQWLILKKSIPGDKSWIWANVAEGALFWGGAPTLGIVLYGSKPGFSYLIFLIVWAAGCRSITGVTLTRVLSQVRSR
jgi:hypothetical protein